MYTAKRMDRYSILDVSIQHIFSVNTECSPQFLLWPDFRPDVFQTDIFIFRAPMELNLHSRRFIEYTNIFVEEHLYINCEYRKYFYL